MNIGMIYLIQPKELIGTHRYKIGMTNIPNLNRCNNGYLKGSRYICIMECNNPFALEKNIKKIFKEKFKLIAGHEYFEGDEEIMIEEFLKLIMDHYKNIKHIEQINTYDIPLLKNNYKDKIIISKDILIENTDIDDYIFNDIKLEFFSTLLYGRRYIGEDITDFKTRCTGEYYDNIINDLREETFGKDEYKICDYLMIYKNIIIQILNKNFDEDNTDEKFNCYSKSFCEFLGYYDNNYSFLTSEYLNDIIKYNCEKYQYYEIIKEKNNKYSGIILYEERIPVFISNIDLDYDYNENHYGNFYDNCQRYLNENKFIQEHLEGHLDNWEFNNISSYSSYEKNDTEFNKIIYSHIIKLSIKDEFSEKIISLIQNNKNILEIYKDNKIMKTINKYKNLRSFIKNNL